MHPLSTLRSRPRGADHARLTPGGGPLPYRGGTLTRGSLQKVSARYIASSFSKLSWRKRLGVRDWPRPESPSTRVVQGGYWHVAHSGELPPCPEPKPAPWWRVSQALRERRRPWVDEHGLQNGLPCRQALHLALRARGNTRRRSPEPAHRAPAGRPSARPRPTAPGPPPCAGDGSPPQRRVPATVRAARTSRPCAALYWCESSVYVHSWPGFATA
jgi:hypothetical protein